MKQFIVKNHLNQFLASANRFSDEFPDALQWSTVYGAATAAANAGGGLVIQDYGLRTERSCLVVTADGVISKPTCS